ncbi:helix-turn-helix domain-containing protein [uncultured Robinsoniella sp.]|uniref:helix-turn-helix domain-containing protein n=1 Tax=uncultured Robinsoniella sp. TaxID=904190 RepID=UPI00374FBA3E
MMILRAEGFPENLLRLRKAKGLSQYELVAEMQLLGSTISRSTYAKIERGERNIKVTDLVVLQKIYNVAYDEFFKGISYE